MAKGSLSGVRKGKKGDSVYYRVAASNNKEKQGERQYVGEVTNPRTDAQVEQRMKMTPAVNLYRVLKDDVLDHSFQGIKYGARSHSVFMKGAMSAALGSLPYLSKGETKAIPAPYIISKGSLPDVGVIALNGNDAITAISTAFITNYNYNTPYSEIVDAFVNNNPMLKKGDQLTFVSCKSYQNETRWNVQRLILDASKYDNNATLGQVSAKAQIRIDADGIALLGNIAGSLVAAGIILSRPAVAKTNGAVSWLRSTTSLFVAPTYMETWQTEEKLNEAIASYKTKGATPTSDWYLNDGTMG